MLEDAAYRGLSFGVHEPPSLWRLDREGETVILARTFSKTFSPGLKIGYGVLPRGLIDPILSLKGNHDFGSANFNQQLLEQILASGDYDRHVARLRELYGRKCDVFVGALERSLEPVRDQVHWTHPNGGLFVWMTVPEGLDTGFDGPLFPRCVQEGVFYVPGEYAFAPEPGAGAEEPHPADLRGAGGIRAGRGGAAAGRGDPRLPERGRLTDRLGQEARADRNVGPTRECNG